ncbi:DUF2197 domain-containing protein [Pueribacillus theae]|uniref:DUF2197 domain-containing protein n=1 Tax=Pueribacillus theae TaxID=2171751 RepID=A0A2U1K756_9BACI|nr:YlaI family protein [Pueribacillus theae]PWA13370.1 DUF2197 domain-containing protein [Pueribacillus theae]
MRVKCVLCDAIKKIDDETSLAKRLRNRPIHTFMCDECHSRITVKTKKHLASESFKLYRTMEKNELF